VTDPDARTPAMAVWVPRDTSATARDVALRAVSAGAINGRAKNTELVR
jgi:hypothetical protein